MAQGLALPRRSCSQADATKWSGQGGAEGRGEQGGGSGGELSLGMGD